MAWKHATGLACLLVLGCTEARRHEPAGATGVAAGTDAATAGVAAGAAPAGAPHAGAGAGAGRARAHGGEPAPADAGPDSARDAGGGPHEPGPCDDASCDPEEASCEVVAGVAVCTCATGYRDVHGDGRLCEGIDACESGAASCTNDAACIDTPSGHTCLCERGFHGDGFTSCEPNVACSPDGADACVESASCLLLDGSVRVCACGRGAEGDGLSCSDVDQCARGLHDCHGLAQCTNDGREFECQCPDGYLGDGHGDAGCFLPTSRVTEPRIPDVGDEPCPTFAVGTSTLPDLLGATLQVGEKAATPTAPLLFYWHGTGSTASEIEQLPQAMRQEILEAGGVLVALERSTGTGGDCSGVGVFAKDDLRMADRIAACAVRDHNVDPRRIYVTGCSSGGLQAGCMAIERSSYVAAVVTNSGGLVWRETMQAAHAPATLTMHGSPRGVAIDFGQNSRALTRQVKAFGGEAVNCFHSEGTCGAPAELHLQAWEFMKAHPFGAGTAPYAQGLPPGFPSYCKKL